MIHRMEIDAAKLKIYSRDLMSFLGMDNNSCVAVDIRRSNPIEDVEFEEIEPDPNAGPAPVASLLYNPNK